MGPKLRYPAVLTMWRACVCVADYSERVREVKGHSWHTFLKSLQRCGKSITSSPEQAFFGCVEELQNSESCRVRHSVAVYGQRLLFCDQSMREKAWRSRKRGA